MADRLWQSQPPKEVDEISCQHEQSQTHLIGNKPLVEQSRPVQREFALLLYTARCATPIEEIHNITFVDFYVGENEFDPEKALCNATPL